MTQRTASHEELELTPIGPLAKALCKQLTSRTYGENEAVLKDLIQHLSRTMVNYNFRKRQAAKACNR